MKNRRGKACFALVGLVAAVLSQDIFAVPVPELPKTESVLTLVGGKTVYDAGILGSAAEMH